MDRERKAVRRGHAFTIGVFTAELDDAYQVAVWRGVESRAEERGTGVVCFLGSRVGSPIRSETAANVAYRVADLGGVDGLIVVSSAISTYMNAEGLSRFFSSRRAGPLVSIGLKVPGIPSITADGSAGVKALVGHLIREHGLRRFALIAGPRGHAEAEDRQRAFHEALRDAGVRFDTRLAARGTFVRESGARAARALVRRKVPFDALVCMNDSMALGALDVIREKGLKVPADVAVVGFDGIEEGMYVTPPLTTVTQPLRELGISAVDALLALLDGGKPRDKVLTCAPAIRQSCGCHPGRGCSEKSAIPSTASGAERRAMAELASLARKPDHDGFIARLNTALAATVLEDGRPRKWNDYLSAITRAPGARHARETAELFESARVLVGETESRLQAARRVAAQDRLATLRSISAPLAGAFEMPVMLERLTAGLVRLGMGRGYLALFEEGGPSTGWVRLVMNPGRRGAVALPANGLKVRVSRLLPPRMTRAWRKATWVLEPLVFQDEPLGFIVLPGGAVEPAVYGTLREQVASALKGALLLRQVRSHERRLEAEVARRTAELTLANEELTQEIERRLRLEREVVEISNRTMQRIGQDLHDDLCQHLAGVAMLASVLRGGLSDVKAVTSIEKIGELLEDSIVRAKQIARGLYPAGLEEHGLAAAVEELVEAARRSHPVIIDFRASPDFRLAEADGALQVYRIIQEALTNALKHSGSDRVEVRLAREDRGRGTLVVEVTDHGSGLPAAIPRDAMGLRIMRSRAEMAGAELKIVRGKPGTRVSCRIPCGRGGS